ncbi:protein kinase [Nocardia sp. 2]|uniref:non-specific serine/threonine protein kinase n=1 Tax=Nocardia acididurans TaxID=2802282 RepID=A0ABS1M1B2_9NOCA|nr:protein kinase [Nocardia acididurans]MBL1074452.1 protein kinase [Nocardia acididurans]
MGTTLRPGENFAGYQILRRLGAGGMGAVYQARDRDLPRFVALKLLTATDDADPEHRVRFLREADSVARLEHPNIVTVYSRGEDAGQLWISMTFVDGTDVATALRQGAIHPARAVRILTETAAALDHAHETGILHRDVKPANILLTQRGGERVLLTDFGIAKARDESHQLTRKGEVVASFQYVAPERLTQPDDADHRADIYSLGCTFYHMLTGRAPYGGEDVGQIVYGHAYKPVPRPTDQNDTLPRALDEVIARAMAKDPTGRYQTCAQFARAAAQSLRRPPPARTPGSGTPAVPSAGPTTPGTAPTATGTASTAPGTAPTRTPATATSFPRIPKSALNTADAKAQHTSSPRIPTQGTSGPGGTAQGPAASRAPAPGNSSPRIPTQAAPAPGLRGHGASGPRFRTQSAGAGFSTPPGTTRQIGDSGPLAGPGQRNVTPERGRNSTGPRPAVGNPQPARTVANTPPPTRVMPSEPRFIPPDFGDRGERGVGADRDPPGRERRVAVWLVAGLASVLALVCIAYAQSRAGGEGGGGVSTTLPTTAVTTTDSVTSAVDTTVVTTSDQQVTTGQQGTTGQGTTPVKTSDVVITDPTVPDVVGTAYTQAKTKLENAGFTVTKVEKTDSSTAGTVLSLDPGAGTSAKSGSTITVTVSSGPAKKTITMPNLVGLDAAQAAAVLKEQGWAGSLQTATTTVTDSAQVGVITAQDPASGSDTTVDSTVTITIGKLKA